MVARKPLYFSLFDYIFCTNVYKSRMYIRYWRLDINAPWFKYEAITPFELGTTAIDRSCPFGDLHNIKTSLAYL